MPPGKTSLANSDFAEVGPAEVRRNVLGPFFAQGGAAHVCGDDVVDVKQYSQNLATRYHVKTARAVFGLGEAKLDEGLASRRVQPASGSGVAVHVSNICNHLAALLVPPLVALRDVGVDLLVGWPISPRVGLDYIIALHVRVMLSGDGKNGQQSGVLERRWVRGCAQSRDLVAGDDPQGRKMLACDRQP
eukprot:3472195-Pleurochrysis_carterae.AAC.3